MGTWGVHQYRGSVAGHVFAVAAEKAQAAKEDARKPATERAQPKREWQSQQTRHALADALKEVLDDLRAGPVTGGPAPTQIEAAGGTTAAAATGDGTAAASAAGASTAASPSDTSAAAGGSSIASDSSTSTSSATSTAASTATPSASASTTTGSSTVATGDADGDAQGADATNRTDGGDGNHPVRHALHDFMHALFEALRPNGDSGHGQGRGFGWGRTTVGDLAQRIEQLAQSFASPSAPAASGDASAPAPTTASTGATASTASPATTSTPAAGSTPASTSGSASTTSPSSAATATSGPSATTASNAPGAATTSTASSTSTPSTPSTSATSSADSSLLSAFDELLSALPGNRAATAATNPAEALSALLHRLAQALEGNGGSDSRPATGCLIHVTA